jgi:homoserine O-succinyltransferase/O-acetyltransferase
MPIFLDHGPSGDGRLKATNGLLGKPHVEFRESTANCIEIGLLNNMPDAALQSTERGFLTLIDSAAGGMVVRLSLYSLPDVPRSDAGRRHVSNFYSGLDNLWDRHLDGLIVTGTEPREPNLMDEPYWGSLSRVLEWAEDGTNSTVLSCLAAHAAVLHLDGIDRRRLSDKRFGLFECTRVPDHRLTDGTPLRFPIPQSRWNDLPEPELTACGYQILTRAQDAGVDMFVKQRESLFVFFQGHPEYETNTLLLEYRRDVGRYLRQERDTYPPIPQCYFDAETADAFTALRERALRDRREELLAEFPTARAERRLANTWRSTAARIYANWLTHLWAQKERRLRRRPVQGSLLGSAVR